MYATAHQALTLSGQIRHSTDEVNVEATNADQQRRAGLITIRIPSPFGAHVGLSVGISLIDF
jgi:hypothetical protein